MSLRRRHVLFGLGAVGVAGCTTTPPIVERAPPPPIPQDPIPRADFDPGKISLSGPAMQGGALIGLAPPQTAIKLDGVEVTTTTADGFFVVGFDRDAASTAIISTETDSVIVQIKPGDYDIQRIDGLPQDTVTPEAPATLAKIAAEAERKADGFASNVPTAWFKDGFDIPLEYTRVSGRFGGQRILNGTPSRPHYGADLAALIGTPVRAPCDGIVSFAETGLHFEGGLIMIDHGQGLVTAYLHLSKVEVGHSQMVERGQKIGEVGAEGRATGPHLCWRMKWRNRNLDPMLLVGLKAPNN